MAENSAPDVADSRLPGLMPNRLPADAPAPADDPRPDAKRLLRTIRSGTLATIDRNTGHPFASLVNVATDLDGAPVIFTSRLAAHTANLEQDGRASVLLASSGKGDPLAHPRVTLSGAFAAIPHDDRREERLRRRFLASHPKSALYAGFADFSFWRLDVVSAHFNGGFGRAADLVAADVLTDLAGAEDLVTAESGAVSHMNDDHAVALRLFATRLLGADDGAWRATGLDPEGLDLALGGEALRLGFPYRVTTAEGLRSVLVELAKTAQGAAGAD
jgi:hypothetical protein